MIQTMISLSIVYTPTGERACVCKGETPRSFLHHKVIHVVIQPPSINCSTPSIHRLDAHLHQTVSSFTGGEVADGIDCFIGIFLRQGAGLLDTVCLGDKFASLYSYPVRRQVIVQGMRRRSSKRRESKQRRAESNSTHPLNVPLSLKTSTHKRA